MFRSSCKLAKPTAFCTTPVESSYERRLEFNDKAGICSNINFHSFVVEAGGYDKLTFGKLCDKARLLKLGMGDTEVVQKFFIRMQFKSLNFFYIVNLDDKCRLKICVLGRRKKQDNT